MKTISAALKAHLALRGQTLARCWLCVRTDGTVLAATTHDQDLVFDLEAAMVARGLTPGPGIAGTGSQTYAARSGYNATDIATGSGLNVDTGEAQGMLSSPAITEADMLAGLWDAAAVTIFQVNWSDLSQGAMIERAGTLGEITTDKGYYKAEWRGLMQPYANNLGRIDSPRCNAILGDARCGVNLGTAGDSPEGFTRAGTLDSVSSDGLVLFDAQRTELGPTGGIGIEDISNANPGIVTLSEMTSLNNGDAVTLSGIVGPASLNTTTIIRSLAADRLSWSLGIDTSDTAVYPPFVPDSPASARMTPLGADSGYFDYGKITITSGDNNGLSMEIKSYVPGQITLQLPFPYALTGTETYTIVAGCDKSYNTCKTKFNNLVNMRAFPFLPGIDKMVQVGRRG